MWRIILGIVPFLSLLSTSCNQVQFNSSIKVIDIHDGDTFTLEDDKRIRLFGVDTPEISTENTNHEWTDSQGIEHDYALQARNFAVQKIIKATNIRWEQMTNDKYGRFVAKIFCDDFDLSKGLVQEGLARVAYFSNEEKNPYFTLDMAYIKELLDLQCHAFLAEKGFWFFKDDFLTIFPKAK